MGWIFIKSEGLDSHLLASLIVAGGAADEVENGVALEDDIVGSISPLFNWSHHIARVVVVLVHHQHVVMTIAPYWKFATQQHHEIHYVVLDWLKKKEQ